MSQNDASSIDALSDEEVYRLVEDASKDRDATIGQIPSMDNSQHSPVWRIASDAVAKAVQGQSEAYTMQMVRAHTSIPVPAVRRILPIRHSLYNDRFWIVMDYIPGNTLHEAWPSLSEERKLDIIRELSQYVKELQHVPLPNPTIPGPLHPEGQPRKCIGSFFTDCGAGPFCSYQEMADWFDHQRLCCRIYWHQRRKEWLMPCPRFDTTQPLVLCHMDIQPRNIIVDTHGTPWLIDWEVAGAYPQSFEYAAIVITVKIDHELKALPAWSTLETYAPEIAGDYAEYFHNYLLVLFDCCMGINFSVMFDEKLFPHDYFELLGIEVD